ncbi:MAG: T9SS C-terminal target domain-containing protein [Bacteroidota bacterium]|nr:T9SS C-terminal target domain-containing protein [Bacteroidota bacterium]
MNRFKQLLIVLALALTLPACVKVNFEEEGTTTPGTNNEDPNVSRVLQGSYERNITLTGGTYTIKGYVYFTSGTKLTIPKGTLLKSDLSQKGALIIERGAKIDAQGTAQEPIVFTSGKPAGRRQRGDWGGIILLGAAPTNRPLSPAPLIEGGVDRRYGGTNATDNSGTLRYVRIEWAGIAAEPGSEINGLTLGGVGSGTTLEYIQVSYGNDDAYEFFGGTVNARYLVSYAASDDDLDFDFGYTGKIQYAVVQRRPEIADTDAGNGVEADNDGTGTLAIPFTKPVLSNITWVGPNGDAQTQANLNFANRWRRAVQFEVHNSIMMGFPKAGLSLESAATAEAYRAGTSVFRNNLVHALAASYKVDAAAGGVISEAEVRAKAEAAGTVTYSAASDIMLEAPFNWDAPNFLPKAGSPALTGASFAGLDNAFFTAVPYRGAFGSTNWLAGWTSFTPQANSYQ